MSVSFICVDEMFKQTLNDAICAFTVTVTVALAKLSAFAKLAALAIIIVLALFMLLGRMTAILK